LLGVRKGTEHVENTASWCILKVLIVIDSLTSTVNVAIKMYFLFAVVKHIF